MTDETYERIQAAVKFFDFTKGYGFIKRPNKPDIFFTSKALERANISKINENDLLEFDWIPSKDSGKGGRAINLKKIDKGTI